MDFETYWETLSNYLKNIRNTPSFVLSKLIAEDAWRAAQKKEKVNIIDHVYLVKAFWPSEKAVMIWRDNMFESEREAKEMFDAYATTFPEINRPVFINIILVTIGE